MIENFVQPIMNGILWLLLSKEGREWMPFIMYISLIWVVSFAIWFFFRKDEE